MTTGSDGSPASLYGPVSLVLGVLALLTAVFAGFLGIAIPFLFGSLGVTFGLLGLSRRLNRGQCAIGLVAGALGVIYPIFLAGALAF
ncbi:hypothetical protein M4914_05470 [Streptomyces somaliensis DSM 40738]|uniref:Uncharacterized protein n=1 Tax=Streptomyces somaliensis (strain ATCC 33201 / DSM 40738 / JCM 12659 / KCTC 9044 / NCTC 11332 / NRRL B-12077 / IP 733) TaxID=1134445 RepID=A0AA44DCY5_STRE0|nr:hypothetical protein [Streptomyces somaliensis]MCQ0022460.1 hypothetical protein [Streptomyces somaliensis DSM 40738]NKY14596.1 hypothetical protein [Streptomyces somaliensis DSM 40738]